MHAKARQILFRETLMALFFKSPSKLLLILLFLSPLNSYAITEYDIPTDNSVLMAPNAMDSIYGFLGNKNWNEGENFKNRDAKTGQFFLAISPESFSGEIFYNRINELIKEINHQPGARIPGDRRQQNRKKHSRDGVLVDRGLISRIQAISSS